MSLFDFLSKEGRKAGALKRNMSRVMNKHAQSPDRMRALELLAQEGSDEALFGLLRRFSYVYDKSIEDEQEKEWVEQALIEKGAQALPMVRKYLREADSIAWPLRVLEKTATPEEIHEILVALVEQNEPGYTRDPSKKIQLVTFLGEHQDARMSAMLVPYLADVDEGVRFTAVEALFKQKNETVAREPLCAHLVKAEEESGRIKLRIAEGFAQLGWTVKGFSGQVEKTLPAQYLLDASGHIKRKGA